jgi:hypothetical protein
MTNNKKPNFLLVGAQKAGSTSLYNYMKEHPQIFMSAQKEPLYFISDVVKQQISNNKRQNPGKKEAFITDNYNDYLKLFEDATNEIAIGEASAGYLYYHNVSIPRIKSQLGNIKILIILRNPLEKVYSQYKRLKKIGEERYGIIKAISKEPERKKKNYRAMFHYISQSLYYEQVKAFYDNFSNVKVILLDDLKNNPNEVMKSVFSFLSVDTNYTLQNHNIHFKTGYIPSSRKIDQFVTKNKRMNQIKSQLKRTIPGMYKKVGAIYTAINSSNQKLTNKAKQVIYDYVYNDIIKLEELIEVDLTSWKESFK